MYSEYMTCACTTSTRCDLGARDLEASAEGGVRVQRLWVALAEAVKDSGEDEDEDDVDENEERDHDGHW